MRIKKFSVPRPGQYSTFKVKGGNKTAPIIYGSEISGNRAPILTYTNIPSIFVSPAYIRFKLEQYDYNQSISSPILSSTFTITFPEQPFTGAGYSPAGTQDAIIAEFVDYLNDVANQVEDDALDNSPPKLFNNSTDGVLKFGLTGSNTLYVTINTDIAAYSNLIGENYKLSVTLQSTGMGFYTGLYVNEYAWGLNPNSEHSDTSTYSLLSASEAIASSNGILGFSVKEDLYSRIENRPLISLAENDDQLRRYISVIKDGIDTMDYSAQTAIFYGPKQFRNNITIGFSDRSTQSSTTLLPNSKTVYANLYDTDTSTTIYGSVTNFNNNTDGSKDSTFKFGYGNSLITFYYGSHTPSVSPYIPITKWSYEEDEEGWIKLYENDGVTSTAIDFTDSTYIGRGGILTVSETPVSGGSGYEVGDILEIDQSGAYLGQVIVVETDVIHGEVTKIKTYHPGCYYSVDPECDTIFITARSPGGTGCTVEITSVTEISDTNFIGKKLAFTVSSKRYRETILAFEPSGVPGHFKIRPNLDITATTPVATGSLDVHEPPGRLEIYDDVYIHGNLVVSGENDEANQTTVSINQPWLYLNYGETGDGISSPYLSGIKVNRGIQPDANFYYYDSYFSGGGSYDGTWVLTHDSTDNSNHYDTSNTASLTFTAHGQQLVLGSIAGGNADYGIGTAADGDGYGLHLFTKSGKDIVFWQQNGTAVRYTSGSVSTGRTKLATLANGGQLQLPITGSGAGILVGGDTQFYRSGTESLTFKTPTNAGFLLPHTDGDYSLGSNTKKWDKVYTDNVTFANTNISETPSNEVTVTANVLNASGDIVAQGHIEVSQNEYIQAGQSGFIADDGTSWLKLGYRGTSNKYTIRSDNASDTTLYIENAGAGVMDVDIEGDLTVNGATTYLGGVSYEGDLTLTNETPYTGNTYKINFETISSGGTDNPRIYGDTNDTLIIENRGTNKDIQINTLNDGPTILLDASSRGVEISTNRDTAGIGTSPYALKITEQYGSTGPMSYQTYSGSISTLTNSNAFYIDNNSASVYNYIGFNNEISYGVKSTGGGFSDILGIYNYLHAPGSSSHVQSKDIYAISNYILFTDGITSSIYGTKNQIDTVSGSTATNIYGTYDDINLLSHITAITNVNGHTIDITASTTNANADITDVRGLAVTLFNRGNASSGAGGAWSTAKGVESNIESHISAGMPDARAFDSTITSSYSSGIGDAYILSGEFATSGGGSFSGSKIGILISNETYSALSGALKLGSTSAPGTDYVLDVAGESLLTSSSTTVDGLTVSNTGSGSSNTLYVESTHASNTGANISVVNNGVVFRNVDYYTDTGKFLLLNHAGATEEPTPLGDILSINASGRVTFNSYLCAVHDSGDITLNSWNSSVKSYLSGAAAAKSVWVNYWDTDHTLTLATATNSMTAYNYCFNCTDPSFVETPAGAGKINLYNFQSKLTATNDVSSNKVGTICGNENYLLLGDADSSISATNVYGAFNNMVLPSASGAVYSLYNIGTLKGIYNRIDVKLKDTSAIGSFTVLDNYTNVELESGTGNISDLISFSNVINSYWGGDFTELTGTFNQVDNIANGTDIYGIKNVVIHDTGAISGSVYGYFNDMSLYGGSVIGNAYGVNINLNTGGIVAGTNYGLFIEGLVDQNYLEGDLTISPSNVPSTGNIVVTDGDVTIPAANDYKYATVKTGYLNLMATDFIPDNSDAASFTMDGSPLYLQCTSGTDVTTRASLYLPDGVTLTSFNAGYAKTGTDDTFEVHIYWARKSDNTLVGNLSYTLAGSPGGTYYYNNTNIVTDPVINNTAYWYWVELVMKSGTGDPTPQLWVLDFVYTYDTLVI